MNHLVSPMGRSMECCVVGIHSSQGTGRSSWAGHGGACLLGERRFRKLIKAHILAVKCWWLSSFRWSQTRIFAFYLVWLIPIQLLSISQQVKRSNFITHRPKYLFPPKRSPRGKGCGSAAQQSIMLFFSVLTIQKTPSKYLNIIFVTG